MADKSPVVVGCDQQDQVNASVEGSAEAMVATAKKSSGQDGAGSVQTAADQRVCKICTKEAQFLCSGCRVTW